MQIADLPAKFVVQWANDAPDPTYVRTVPLDPSTEGFASFRLGFPPVNFQEEAAGGIPPFGQDVNGTYRAITAWLRFVQAGTIPPYDASWAGNVDVGGYPAGALVLSAVTQGLAWFSTADNNTADPDVAGTNWIPVPLYPRNRTVTASGALTISIADHGSIIGLRRATSPAVSSGTIPTTNLFTGFRVGIADLYGNFNAFPVTITPPGGMNFARLSTAVLNVDRSVTWFEYFGGNNFGLTS